MNDDLWYADPAQLTAQRAFWDAPDYHARPCATNPKAWDNGAPRDVAAAIQACRTRCPVLAQCKALVASGVQIDGVVAGQTRGGRDHDQLALEAS